MAKRQRDYAAEYAARKARALARGFTSPRAETKARRAQRSARPPELTEKQRSDVARFAREGRRVSKSFHNPEGPFKFREDKADSLSYTTKYHNWYHMTQQQGTNKRERDETLRLIMEEQYDLEIEDLDEFFNDGGSVPE